MRLNVNKGKDTAFFQVRQESYHNFSLPLHIMVSNSFRKLFDRTCRWTHSLGFGVQSTSAYRFIRYVVKERCPYYAYADLREKYPELHEGRRRLGELLLRLANHVQPRHTLLFGYGDVAEDYIQAGCKRTLIEHVETGLGPADYRRILAPLGTIGLCCAAAVPGQQAFLDATLDHTRPESIVLVEGIDDESAGKSLWQRLVGDTRVGVSYDLRSFGLLCFDHRVYKQNYKIML